MTSGFGVEQHSRHVSREKVALPLDGRKMAGHPCQEKRIFRQHARLDLLIEKVIDLREDLDRDAVAAVVGENGSEIHLPQIGKCQGKLIIDDGIGQRDLDVAAQQEPQESRAASFDLPASRLPNVPEKACQQRMDGEPRPL